ncbi:BTAD domain-containing putative transcriptional regulator [Roseomonas sp. HF4]|uniref:BTAD domain-containing putative transcriptional regulator n=1 Tax=Roseomonas sp. HF4 TaxID=2562313 RepID=UPI0010C1166F|nr:BTAD domain-containing putative transcriptional regulator [Roseomonas sp. HF4]
MSDLTGIEMQDRRPFAEVGPSVGRAGTPTPARLRVTMLGRMDVRAVTGESLVPRSRKTRAVLGVLAMDAPTPISRQRLAELLWSRRGEDQARGSLRQALHELQDVLGEWGRGLIVATRETVAINTEGVWIDAREVPAMARDRLEALNLLQADLLADLDGLDAAFDIWLAEQRRRLRDVALDAATARLAAAGNVEQRVQEARRVLAIDPAQEPVWRILIRAEAERGDRGTAFAAWEECRRIFAERFRSAPSPETSALAESLRGEVAAPVQVTPRRGSIRGARLGVVPLRLIGGGTDADVSLGLAGEITAALARFRWLVLVDSSSVAAAERQPGGGEELGLDFSLSGSVQRSGDRVRVTLRLTDHRPPESVVWAERFDRDAGDILALQDEIAAEVVARVDPEILLIEANRAVARPHVHANAYDLLLRAIPAIYRLDRQSYELAGRMLDEATRLEPDYAPAFAWHAYWHLFLVGQGWAQNDGDVLAKSEELASRAVALDPSDAQALTVLGHVRAFLHHRVAEAVTLYDRALALNPNLPMAWVFSALALSYRGQHAEALTRWERYKRLAPLHPHAFFFDAARLVPLLLLHRHADVDADARRVTALHAGFTFPYKAWLSALGHLGRREQAAEVRARLLAIEPDFTLAKARERAPMRVPADLDHYLGGLRRAGIS